MYSLKEIKNKRLWEDFISRCSDKTFLQSWNWGRFNEDMGDQVYYLGIFQDTELLGTALVVKTAARRGNFLLVPHGPNVVQSANRKKVLEVLTERLRKMADEGDIDFIRVAPIWQRSEESERIFREFDFREAPIHVHPELTWELDMAPAEETIMAGMRKTTRYLIRKALRERELHIEKSRDVSSVAEFNNLYQATKDRHSFVPFSLDYLEKEFAAFSGDEQISVFLAKYREETLSSGIFIFWQGIGFYHHGASSQKYPKVPASYLLLWEAIKEARRRGCRKFNFWGVSPPEDRKHPWAGLSLFKEGFGGNYHYYVKTQDIPVSAKYWFTFLIESVRKVKRGF